MTTSATLTLKKARNEPTDHLTRQEPLGELARLIRYYVLAATTKAGSGHPTSALSATDLMTGLVFGGTFRFDAENPQHPNNDRLIFSKGHASPLFYGLWTATGYLSEEELMSYRQFGSPLEGHPTPVLDVVEAATGSLGQGLSIGVGMALNAKYLDELPYRTYVLLGDSEMAEGSQWEAMEIAAKYQLDHLVGILDVNRLGQCGETLHGHDLTAYDGKIRAFGWETLLIDGHSLPEICKAYQRAANHAGRPTMILARTLKGKGVPEVEDKEGWHGKALDEQEFQRAVAALGDVNRSLRGSIPKPQDLRPKHRTAGKAAPIEYKRGERLATRVAYGNTLKRLGTEFPKVVALDAEVSNSTKSEAFKQVAPDRFFEMHIAEQNMVGAALGLSRRGKVPFVSTFAAFLTRAFDQIRMAQYSDANIKFVGSHAGVSIGEDGPSQMGLEDIAMFRAIPGSVVLHPCDAVSTEALVEQAVRHPGMLYLRTLRQTTPVIYETSEAFPIGGSKALRQSGSDVVTVVAAGTTVHEALTAYESLKREGIAIRVIDAYSIKPLDEATLLAAARDTAGVLTVEDHHAAGGLGEAVMSVLATTPTPVHSLAVWRRPRSGTPEALRVFEDISHKSIALKVAELQAGALEQADLQPPGKAGRGMDRGMMAKSLRQDRRRNPERKAGDRTAKIRNQPNRMGKERRP